MRAVDIHLTKSFPITLNKIENKPIGDKNQFKFKNQNKKPKKNIVKNIEELKCEILFPLSPYTVQETFVKSMTNAILNKQNALLESPTGTGKTLCLLTSALAAQRYL